MKNINTCYARKHDRITPSKCSEYYCPYPTNERCDEILEKKLKKELRLTFKCVRCNLPFCATYAYSIGSAYCWSCGLKTPRFTHPIDEHYSIDSDIDMT